MACEIPRSTCNKVDSPSVVRPLGPVIGIQPELYAVVDAVGE